MTTTTDRTVDRTAEERARDEAAFEENKSEEQKAADRAEHDWRGVNAENREDIQATASVKLRDRSRRLLGSLLRPYKKWLVLLTGIVVLENASRLAIPYLVKEGIDFGIPPMIAGHGAQRLLEVVIALAVAATMQATTRVLFLNVSGRIGQNILLTLRRRVFRQFQKLDLSFHEKYTSGRVVSRQTSDVDAIQELLTNGFDGLVSAALTLVGTAILLLTLDVKLGLVTLISFPLLAALTMWFRKRSTLVYRRTRETVAAVIVHFVESMQGMKAVQAFRREKRNGEIFEDVNDSYREANLDSFRLVSVFMPSIKFIGNATVAVVLLYGGFLAFDGGKVTVGVLAAFLLYLRQFFEPMQDISQFYNTFQSASAALEKLSGVLEEPLGVPEPTKPKAIEARGRVDFDSVEFSYVADRPVLHELDLHIPAGQTIALVGATGAGKTTLAKLVSRFYDPTSGSVRLDGVDLRDLTEEELREHIVMVTQENFLFTGTVAENIRIGKPTATDEEVHAAARAIGAHTFIEALPNGYDTDVAKRGGRLSAGQRQLVAFARAFLADPDVLILDEATSSLDVPSERLVQQALRTILSKRTALIIAHRLTTVEIADRVLVMMDGRLVEDGSPEELIEGGGQYAHLHQAWEDSLA
jgi:ATP-binding cassette, subfamily B, bacterial